MKVSQWNAEGDVDKSRPTLALNTLYGKYYYSTEIWRVAIFCSNDFAPPVPPLPSHPKKASLAVLSLMVLLMMVTKDALLNAPAPDPMPLPRTTTFCSVRLTKRPAFTPR